MNEVYASLWREINTEPVAFKSNFSENISRMALAYDYHHLKIIIGEGRGL
jgi:hypothetical protein